MGKLIYLDTNIYLDFLLNRKSVSGHPFGYYAEKVFERTLACEFEIVLSDWIIQELDRAIGADRFTMLYSFLEAKRKIVRIKYLPEDIEKAKKMSIHFQDVLHEILADRSGAELIITRNISDFGKTNLRVKAKRPENL